MWALIQGLPPEAILWADFAPSAPAVAPAGPIGPMEFDEPVERPRVTRDSKEIAAFFGKHLKG